MRRGSSVRNADRHGQQVECESCSVLDQVAPVPTRQDSASVVYSRLLRKGSFTFVSWILGTRQVSFTL
jgi:hypothetical protein